MDSAKPHVTRYNEPQRMDLGQVYIDPIPENTTPTGQFWRSPRFWLIGAASTATVLTSPDFNSMTWNLILGQIIQYWATAAATVGVLDRSIDAIKK